MAATNSPPGNISFELAHVAARAGAQVTIVHRGERPLELFYAMVPWLVLRLDTIADPVMYRWMGAVCVACGISLLIDTFDVLRYLRGERAAAVVLEG